jgi:hypothetical protein
MEKSCFEKTFQILKDTLGQQVFSGVNSNGNFTSRFLIYHYEAFSVGIQPIIDRVNLSDVNTIAKLKEIFMDIKKDDEFKHMTTGGGKNYSNRLNDRISFVSKRVRDVL